MRLLITGTINRGDILEMLDGLTDHELHFVEYASCLDGDSDLKYADYGELTRWRQHDGALALLGSIQPHRVVMLANTSYNQVALRLAARELGIPTVYLEHGFRMRADSDARTATESVSANARRMRRFSGLRETLENNRFVYKSLQDPIRKRLLAYLKKTYLTQPTQQDLQLTADLRRCDAYIAFSRETFEYHRVTDDIAQDHVRHFVGIPQFDDFAAPERPSADRDESRLAVLIDHQYVNAGYFGWNVEFRRRWANRLANNVADAGLELLVKTHPGDQTDVWAELEPSGRGRLVERDELPGLAARADVVLGILSTLLLPFAGMPNTTLITLEIHPEDGHFVSEQLASAGVAKPVFSWDELENALERRRKIHAVQAESKDSFIEQFLSQVDGGATRRVRRAVLRPFGEPHHK